MLNLLFQKTLDFSYNNRIFMNILDIYNRCGLKDPELFEKEVKISKTFENKILEDVTQLTVSENNSNEI